MQEAVKVLEQLQAQAAAQAHSAAASAGPGLGAAAVVDAELSDAELLEAGQTATFVVSNDTRKPRLDGCVESSAKGDTGIVGLSLPG